MQIIVADLNISDRAVRLASRKAAWRLIPFLILCYLIAFLDRVNVGFAAGAQQRPIPLIGVLGSASTDLLARDLPGFLDGLAKVGFVEGRNVAIEYRYAEGHYERLSPLTIELLARRVTVIFAAGNPAAQAAKPASPLIPVVFAIGGDPVDLGLVASLNRPGGNITGVTFLSTTLVAKSLEILHEVAPDTGVVAAIVNPTNPDTAPNIRALREAARNLRLQLHILDVSSDSDIDTAFDALVQRQVGALLIDGDPLFGSHIDRFVAQLARHPLSAIYQRRLFPDAGGLMSFGASNIDAYRIAGDYVGRILKGEKPADLPVQQSTKAELVINLKAAKLPGLTVPLTLRVRATR